MLRIDFGDNMAVGLLESFGLVENFGKEAIDNGVISVDDVIFVAGAKKKKGCRSISSRLTVEDSNRVMEIGQLIKKWKDIR
jgi:hypothetical protein